MAMDGVRGYLQLASGLVELSRAKAMDAAAAVLALPGSVAGGVSGATSGGGLPGQVQDLAEELMAAAAANRRSLLALIRAEVESALGKAVVVPVDELDRARAAVAKLSADVEELRDQVMASPAVRSIPEPGRTALTTVSEVVSEVMSGAASSVLAHGASLTRTDTPSAPVPTPAPAATRPRPSRRAVKDAATSPGTSSLASTAAAKKVATTKAAPTKKAATTKAATTKKAAATKAAPTKAAPTTASSTKRATPSKKAATTKATAKKATTVKATAKKATAKKATTKKTTTTKATARGGDAG